LRRCKPLVFLIWKHPGGSDKLRIAMAAQGPLKKFIDRLITEGEAVLASEFRLHDVRFKGGLQPIFVEVELFEKWRGRCRLLLTKLGPSGEPWKGVLEEDCNNLMANAKSIQGALKAIKQSLAEGVLTPSSVSGPAAPVSKKVFIVHGRDHGKKEALARFLEKLGLEPVILHEEPNFGRTIIEKFCDSSDVNFAIVLVTGDDEGKGRHENGPPRSRARQNVILELGYFLGKLGRSRVCALYETGVEIPSDYDGVLFVPFDPQETWRNEIVRELKAVGFQIDANRIYGA
jgi:predicted nucleotide-binding protein